MQQAVPRGLTFIVALMTMIGPFTIDTYLPSFPTIEAEFNISRALLSQSLASYLAAFGLSTLILGPLTDRLGRRQVILISLLCYIAASLGCALSSDYSTFMFYRLIQGAAVGGGLVAGRAMIRDVYNTQDAHRAMSQVMMLFAIAPAVAPIIGGWLHDLFGWHSVFYFLIIYAALVFLLVFFSIPETLAVEHRQSFHPIKVMRIYGRTLIHARFLILVFIVASFFAGIFLYIAGAPTFIFDFLNLESNDFGVLFVPMVAGLILGSALSARLAHRWPIESTVKLALIIMTLGALLNVIQSLYLSITVSISVIPLVIYSCGAGMAVPAIMVMSLDCFPNNRGTASAMQGFIQMMVNALIASIAVSLLSLQASHFAMGQAVLLATALLLWWRLPAETPAKAE